MQDARFLVFVLCVLSVSAVFFAEKPKAQPRSGQVYEDEKLDLRVRLAPGWKPLSPQPSSGSIAFTKEGTSFLFHILPASKDKTWTAREVLELTLSEFRKQNKDAVEQGKREVLMLNGGVALGALFRQPDDREPKKMIWVVGISSQGQAFGVLCIAPAGEFDKVKPTFLEMLKSVQPLTSNSSATSQVKLSILSPSSSPAKSQTNPLLPSLGYTRLSAAPLPADSHEPSPPTPLSAALSPLLTLSDNRSQRTDLLSPDATWSPNPTASPPAHAQGSQVNLFSLPELGLALEVPPGWRVFPIYQQDKTATRTLIGFILMQMREMTNPSSAIKREEPTGVFLIVKIVPSVGTLPPDKDEACKRLLSLEASAQNMRLLGEPQPLPVEVGTALAAEAEGKVLIRGDRRKGKEEMRKLWLAALVTPKRGILATGSAPPTLFDEAVPTFNQLLASLRETNSERGERQ